ncbi:NTPase [Bacillus sp. J14TS2]|uniref:DUF84 family protein n=1 Tax=Bacillus sp. J14TS2 TaxID=2807188 RepID=UPI001B2DB6FB|nr:DUF84 family protein [Bacillus sp. J14TS2]GIN73057.1 NTPase [Bacillus sp. J14TS2]
MKIAVGSRNKAKLTAVENVLQATEIAFDIYPIDAPSEVSSMPFSDEETMKGAMNRAEYCVRQQDIELGIGLEGGVTETPAGLFLINWGALAVRDQETLVAGGARIKLPEEIAVRLRNGEELGPVMDDFCQRENIRHGEGAIGVFTNGMVTRDLMFTHIMKLLVGQYQYQL